MWFQVRVIYEDRPTHISIPVCAEMHTTPCIPHFSFAVFELAELTPKKVNTLELSPLTNPKPYQRLKCGTALAVATTDLFDDYRDSHCRVWFLTSCFGGGSEKSSLIVAPLSSKQNSTIFRYSKYLNESFFSASPLEMISMPCLSGKLLSPEMYSQYPSLSHLGDL